MSRGARLRRGLTAVAASALVVPLAAVLPARAVGAAPAAPAAAEAAAETGAEGAGEGVPAVAWSPCAGFPGYDCATYRVPLDHDHPRRASIELALTRRPADDQAGKVGSLFLNPGGPGGAGLAFARGASRVLFNDEIRRRFDIVGFDPRGVGESTPVQCFPSDEAFEATLGPVPSVPLGADEIALTLRAHRTWTDNCRANGGPLLHHISTLNVAKDLDLLRRAVGDRKLTYAGYSYGTLIGATYANIHPDKVRALLLDGMVDPAERTRRSLLNELNRAGGFETALRGFLELCDASGAGCAFSAGGSRAKFAALRERLRRGPVALPGGATLTISALTDRVAGDLYDPGAFTELATLLQAWYSVAFPATATTATGRTTTAAKARAAAAARAAGSFRPLAEAYSYNAADALYAVNCVDKRLPRRQTAWPAIAKGFEAVHRTFGRHQAYGSAVCATWPVVTSERYAGPWNRRTSNTLLIVGTYYDPATPYLFAQRAARQLRRARLLSLAGYGHTSILSSTCIDEKTDHYILTGAVPPAGTVCQPDSLPFEPAAAAASAAERAALAEAVGR